MYEITSFTMHFWERLEIVKGCWLVRAMHTDTKHAALTELDLPIDPQVDLYRCIMI